MNHPEDVETGSSSAAFALFYCLVMLDDASRTIQSALRTFSLSSHSMSTLHVSMLPFELLT